MLSNKEIVCPNNLLKFAKKKKDVTAGIVNAGKPLPMHSAMEAVKENLISSSLEPKRIISLIFFGIFFHGRSNENL